MKSTAQFLRRVLLAIFLMSCAAALPDANAQILPASPNTCTTGGRPTLQSFQKGHWVYDTTIEAPVFWNGSTWKSAANLAAPGAIGGTTPAAITGTTVTATTQFVSPKATLGVQGSAHGILNSSDGLYINTDAATGSGAFEITFGKGRSGTSGGTSMFSIDGTQSAVFSLYNFYVYTAALPFTSQTNYERLGLKMDGSIGAQIAAETGGTGADNLHVVLLPAGAGNAGVGVTAPTSRFQVNGSVATTIATLSGATTLAVTHSTVLCDATSGAFDVTLPVASTCAGRIYSIKKIDSSGNAVGINPNGSELLDGSSSTLSITTQWAGKQIQSNGTSWFVIGSF